MKYQFTNKERCFNYSTMEIEIPKDVVEQGDEAIKDFIIEFSHDAEYIELNETVVKESFVEIMEIEPLID